MSRSSTLTLLSFLCALSAGACGGGDDGPGDGDGGADVADADPAAPDAPPNGIVDAMVTDGSLVPTIDATPPPCNLLSNTAASAPVTLVDTNRPSAQGGTIQAGTYHVTKQEIFTGPGGMTGQVGTTRATWALTATMADVIVAMGGGDDVLAHSDYVTAGNTITVSQTCPTMNVLGWTEYDVSGSTLELHNSTSNIVLTMVRQ